MTIHSVKRGPNGRRLMDFWFDRWTGKPTKEFDWISGNFYRFNHKGSKYLFAKYTLNDSLSHDIYIYILKEPQKKGYIYFISGDQFGNGRVR